MMRQLLLSMLLLQVVRLPVPLRKGSIEGIVVRTGTSDVIEDVRVELNGRSRRFRTNRASLDDDGSRWTVPVQRPRCGDLSTHIGQ
jgi:hypothetical protein